MTQPLVLACLWAIAANVVAMFPSKRNHWPAAWALIAIGVPILGYATMAHGPWVGLVLLVAGMSVLRWPVFFLLRRLTRLGGVR